MRNHRARGALLLAMTCTVFAGACNLITGAHDRVIDSGDVGSRSDRPTTTTDPDTGDLNPIDSGGLVIDPPKDAGPDAPKVIRITVNTNSWATPNGATWEMVGDSGTRISQVMDPGGTHGIIVPNPQPSIPSEDYTVWGVVRCPTGSPTNAEFGVLTRVQTNGAGVGVGSKWGQADEPLAPFIGNFQPPSWNPTLDGKGQDAGYIPNARYQFKLETKGNSVLGKMWLLETEQEPGFAISAPSPWATGRGVGFYTYFPNTAVIEKIEITVP